MRAAEETCFDNGMHPAALMEQAIQGMAAVICEHWPAPRYRNVVVLAGRGNNGGDGLGLARVLQLRGYRCHAACLWPGNHSGHRPENPQTLPSELVENQRQCASFCGVTMIPGNRLDEGAEAFANLCAEADLVIDGVFGAGFRGTTPAREAALFAQIKRACQRREHEEANTRQDGGQRRVPIIVAIDGPSGLSLDGAADPAHVEAMQAHHTLAIAWLKPAHIDDRFAPWTGQVTPIPLDLPRPPQTLARVINRRATVQRLHATLNSMPLCTHKYERGVVGIAAGSSTYPGAAELVVAGALAAAPGYVTWMEGLDDFRPRLPASVVPLAAAAVASDPLALEPSSLHRPKSYVFGPGRAEFSEHDLAIIREWGGPVVLDAGALRHTRVLEVFPYPHAAALQAPRIVTPHRAEFDWMWRFFCDTRNTRNTNSLAHTDTAHTAAMSLLERLQLMATEWRVTVVLKGANTLIANPEGAVLAHPFPNQQLATAGTGDVLAGFLAGLLSRGVPCDLATEATVVIHSLAATVRSLDRSAYDTHGAKGGVAHDFEPSQDCYPLALARAMRTWLHWS